METNESQQSRESRVAPTKNEVTTECSARNEIRRDGRLYIPHKRMQY